MVNLLFSPNGRITSGPFWQGVLILLVVSYVMTALSAFGPQGMGAIWTVLSLALIYPSVCVYAKRFHDAGKSGWWYLAVIGASFVVGIILSVVLTFPRMAELATLGPNTDEYREAVRELQRSLLLPSLFISTVVTLAVAYVVGNLKSDPQENIYGPPPGGGGAPVA